MLCCVQESVVERDQDFWISVCCEFEVKEQLTSLIRVLQYLMTLPQDSEEGERASSEVQPSSILIPNHLYMDSFLYRFILIAFISVGHISWKSAQIFWLKVLYVNLLHIDFVQIF